jgi:xanthine dehydrogenase large subunit
MGQGLFQKVAQVAARGSGVDVGRGEDHRDRYRQGAQHLGHRRLLGHRPERHGGEGGLRHDPRPDGRFIWPNGTRRRRPRSGSRTAGCVGRASYPSRRSPRAYQARSLSSTGFYATPKIVWDRIRGEGRPFFYFAYGAAVTEVVIDTLTGENRILRADILHDCGTSLNPASTSARSRAPMCRARAG